MKVHELIAKLQEVSNQNAEVNFISNMVDIDDSEFDKPNCNIDFSTSENDTLNFYMYKEKEY